jgi:hypothetical protein
LFLEKHLCVCADAFVFFTFLKFQNCKSWRSVLINAMALSVVMCLGFAETSAQNSYSIGFYGGLNRAKAHHLNNGSTSSRPGGVFGLSLDILPANALIGYRAEIHFIQKGASIHGDTSLARFEFNYIEIPLIFRSAARHEGFKPFFFAGPKIGFLLSGRARTKLNGATQKFDLKKDTERMDLSLDGGGGLEYTFSRMTLFGSVRYSHGLLDIDKSRDGEWYSRDFQIISGIHFSFR